MTYHVNNFKYGIHTSGLYLGSFTRHRFMNKPEMRLYDKSQLYTMCFDYEFANSLKAKNKEKALEDAELEPELEKVEEQPIVSKS